MLNQIYKPFLIILFFLFEIDLVAQSVDKKIEFYSRSGFWDRSYAQSYHSNLYNTDLKNNPLEAVPKTVETKESIKNVGKESEFGLFYAGLTLKENNKQNYYIDSWLFTGSFEPMVYAKLQLRNNFIEQDYKYNPARALIPASIPPIDSGRSIEYGGGGLLSFSKSEKTIFNESNVRAFRIGAEKLKFDQRSINEPTAYSQFFMEFFCENSTLWRKPSITRIYLKYEYKKPDYLEKLSASPVDYLYGWNVELYKIPVIPQATFHKSVVRWNLLIALNWKYLEYKDWYTIPSSKMNFGLVMDGAVSGLTFRQMLENKYHLGNDPYDNFMFNGLRLLHCKLSEENVVINFFLDFGQHRFLTTSRNYVNNKNITAEQVLMYSAFHDIHNSTVLNNIRTVDTMTLPENMIRFGLEIFSSGGLRQ